MHTRLSISIVLVLFVSAASSSSAGQWSMPYGGSGIDAAYAVQQTTDGGFIVAGSSTSFGNGYEAWIMKLNAEGQVGAPYAGTWQMSYGDTGTDIANAIQQTADGGYIVGAAQAPSASPALMYGF